MMKRKPHQGSIYNKERTKQKLIAAVGKILVKDGFQNIKINKIELVSGVSKKLIYRYFNGLNGLIKAYLLQADYWNQQIQQTSTEGHPDKEEPLELEEIFSIIKSDFEYFDRFREMQKIILWGISTKNKTLKDIAANRELFGKKIFERSWNCS